MAFGVSSWHRVNLASERHWNCCRTWIRGTPTSSSLASAVSNFLSQLLIPFQFFFRHSFLSQAQGLLGCSAISFDPLPRVSLHFTLHLFFSDLLIVWNTFPAFILLAFNPSSGCIVPSEHWGLLSSDYGEIESVTFELVL